jgi:hypothetical protein
MMFNKGLFCLFFVLIFFTGCKGRSNQVVLSQRVSSAIRLQEARGVSLKYEQQALDSSSVLLADTDISYNFKASGGFLPGVYEFYKRSVDGVVELLGSYQVNSEGNLTSLKEPYRFFNEQLWLVEDIMFAEPVEFALMHQNTEFGQAGVKIIPKPITSKGRNGQLLQLEMLSSNAESFRIIGTSFSPKELLLINSSSRENSFFTGLQVDPKGLFVFYLKTKEKNYPGGELTFSVSGRSQEKISLPIVWGDKAFPKKEKISEEIASEEALKDIKETQ